MVRVLNLAYESQGSSWAQCSNSKLWQTGGVEIFSGLHRVASYGSIEGACARFGDGGFHINAGGAEMLVRVPGIAGL